MKFKFYLTAGDATCPPCSARKIGGKNSVGRKRLLVVEHINSIGGMWNVIDMLSLSLALNRNVSKASSKRSRQF